MTSLSFDNKVLIEQVRCIESQHPLTNDTDTPLATDAVSVSDRFSGRLLQRARLLVRVHNLEAALAHASGVWRLSNILAGAVAVMLGASASLLAVSGDSTINIYWLLLVLVGFNLLSMLLWLLGVTSGMDSLISGAFSKASAWLPTALGKGSTPTGFADRSWLSSHLASAVGKWRFSQITQQLWLLYLSAGLVALMLALMARQYDFVWGTTLLSHESFVKLTSVLGQPLEALGFTTPSEQQVVETRIGAGYTLDADHRYSWAQFLIGALLVFGILPRLLLLLSSRAMLGLVQGQFVLDYYLPYYVRLRQELLPLHGNSEIVDADTAPPEALDGDFSQVHTHTSADQLPTGVKWIAVELGDDVTWPLATLTTHQDLGSMVDRVSQERILQRLLDSPGQDIAIAVSAGRPPDRGLKRTVSELKAAASAVWLVLIEKSGRVPTSDTRLTAWYRLAQECKVPAQNVILVAER